MRSYEKKGVGHKKGCGAWKFHFFSNFSVKKLHIQYLEAFYLVLSEIRDMTSYSPPLLPPAEINANFYRLVLIVYK